MSSEHYAEHGQSMVQAEHRVSTLAPELVEQVQELRQLSKADNTRKAYASDWSRWQAWCAARGLQALPAGPGSVAAYLADHAGQLKVSTLRRHLASISKAHQVAGASNPVSTELVRDTLAGLRRVHGAAPDQAPPLLREHLLAILELLEADTGPAVLRDRVLLLLGWCGALRRSELAGLRWGDLQAAQGGMVLHLRGAKTDKTGTGQQVALPRQERQQACPVAAVEAWRAYLEQLEGASAAAADQPVLRQVTKHGQVLQGGLSAQSVASVVRRRAGDVGLSDARGHSLRVGLVWSAAQAGVADSAVMQTTRHSSMTMLRRYQRDAGLMSRAASAGLLS
jgi:integrase